MNLFQLGRDIARVGRDYQRVNWGGCACVAAMIAKRLEERGVDHSIVVSGAYDWSDNTEGNLHDFREELLMNNQDPREKSNWYGFNVGFSHLWVEIEHEGERYALDCDGLRLVEDMYEQWGAPFEGSFTLEEVEAMGNTANWNPTFNRRQLPAMEKDIDYYFKIN